MTDDPDAFGSNPSTAPHFGDIAARMLSRRAALGGALAAGVAAAAARAPAQAAAPDVAPGPAPDHALAPGYRAQVIIRWGDAVLPGAPGFDPAAQTGAAQARQFGYNNDFLAFLPLPQGGGGSDHGLLWVNHEYSQLHMMFPGLTARDAVEKATAEMAAVELAAVGGSIVEVRRAGGSWQVVADSRYARRVSLGDTAIRLAGPAAGDARLRTSDDPTGARVIGTLGNCAGGVTPWGTVLSAEENFDASFTGTPPETGPEARNHRRYGVSGRARSSVGRFHPRFDLAREPNEPNRFGWVVEIDPYDPDSMPVKRTALGRFKHEGATVWVNPNGTVTVYSGDDARNEYLYKFVSAGRYDPANRAANRDLLDTGTLYAARFADDGTVRWLALRHGVGPLTAANGFHSQADVLIEARRAADLLGATPMDRPEDMEVNPVNGRCYVVLTNNDRRKAGETDRANPRAPNLYGHIIELLPPGEGAAADHSVSEHRWDMFLLGGPASAGGTPRPGRNADAWIACPDNIAFDKAGRMWIATDQGGQQARFGVGDGLWVVDTAGPERAVGRFLYRVPAGAELCGPCFTPDNRTLFVAVQHPGADAPGATYDTPASRWPDFRPDMPPRPAVVAITRADGASLAD